MEDGIMTASARMLFSVRKHGDEYILENICGTLKRKPPIVNLKEAFPAKATEKIIQKCQLALSGQQDSDSFTVDLGYHEPYMIYLIHHDNSTSFFSAEPIIHTENGCFFDSITSKSFEQTKELCDASHDGMFVWQVCESGEFFLFYANTAFCKQASLPSAIFGQTFNELFSHRDVIIAHRELDACVKTGQPVRYNNEYANKTFCVSLYPVFEGGHIVRIAGTSTDITEHVSKTYQLECTNKQLLSRDRALCEQVQFEQLIARIAREYMDTDNSGFSVCTDRLVAGLGSLLQVDFACVWKNNGTLYGTSSEWLAAGDDKTSHMFQTVINSGYGTWINQFRSGRIIAINDLDSEKQEQYSAFMSTGFLRSILIVPIMRGKDFWGVICAAQQHSKRIWTTIDISRLKVAADTIMSAHLRMKKEKHLSESNKVLVEYDESLQEMLDVQESLANVSRQYTIAESDHFSSCTEDMLEVLGGLTEVDLACIHVFDNESFVCYKWRKKGLPCSHLRVNDFLPNPDWKDCFSDNKIYIVSNMAEEHCALPSSLMDKMLGLGIKSFMVIPFRDDETIWGVLVLSKILGCHNWNNTRIHTAKQFAQVFHGAYKRMCKERQLIAENQAQSANVLEAAKHADILQKVARSAQLFFNVSADNLAGVFSTVCEEIAESLQIRSVSLTRYNEDFTKTCIVLDWVSSRRLKRTSHTLNHHDNTVLSIPVMYREAVWGCLLVNCALEKPSDTHLDTLELMAQYCVRAYMRIYPFRQYHFSPELEKSCHKALSLKTQPAAI